jgi:uncharacterized membrane protein (UPF0127 family)
VNTTRKTVLARSGVVLTNPLRQAFGTMFHRLPGSYVFTFPFARRVAITNLFVFTSLDILWLDASGRVLAVRERFPPFALSANPPVRCVHIIELPAGVLARSRTQLQDRIQITASHARDRC